MKLKFENLFKFGSVWEGKPQRKRTQKTSQCMSFVALESRNLLAAIVPNATTGIVDVYATPGSDTLLITDNPGTGTFTVDLQVAIPYLPVSPVTLNYADYDLVNGWGGSGDDLMDNTAFIKSHLVGHDGNDTLRGGFLDDTIYGGAGDDIFVGRAGNDTMAGQGGLTWAWGSNGDDTFYGGVDADYFYGGAGNDLAYGGDGNDMIYGEAGDDILWGGNHDDTVEGNDGNDKLYGQGGNDVLQGHGGNDQMWAHAGDDSLYGSSGDDGLYGGDGNDLAIGGNGNDDVRGDAGHDVLWGGDGNDFMMGGTGNDVMSGEGGTDTLRGEAGADSLNGGGQATDNYDHGETDGSRVVYLNFDGVHLTHAQLEAWDNDWSGIVTADDFDAEDDGVNVGSFMDQLSNADRDELIQGMMVRLLADLDEWGINVQRHHGAAVANDQTTTVFLGQSDLSNGGTHIACDLDTTNNNQTDIAFVGDEYYWTTPTAQGGYGGTITDTAITLADVLLHEVGHTYGLEHVVSGSDNESMGYRYNNPQANWVQDTEFRNQAYNLLHRTGTQNAWQHMNSIF